MCVYFYDSKQNTILFRHKVEGKSIVNIEAEIIYSRVVAA